MANFYRLYFMQSLMCIIIIIYFFEGQYACFFITVYLFPDAQRVFLCLVEG